MDFKLTEEHLQIREMARNFTQKVLKPGVIDRDRDMIHPTEFIKQMGELGFMGMMVDPKYGGGGMDTVSYCIAMEEISKLDASCSVAMSVNNSLVCWGLEAYGTEEQKKYYLPRVQSCEHIWCQGYSEPNAGSDLAGIKTTAVLDDDHWTINGQKTWSTLAHKANMCFVVCRTDKEAGAIKPQAGLSFMLVSMDENGVEVRPIKQITGAVEFNEIFFTNTLANNDCVLGEVGDGWKVAMATLGFERASAFLDQQALFSKDFSRLVEIAKELSVDTDPLIRQKFVQSYIGLQTMRLTAIRMLPKLLVKGKEIGPRSSILKLNWTRWFKEFGSLVDDVQGTKVLVTETTSKTSDELTGISKVALSSLGPSIFAGTTEIQKDIIANHVLGLPR